MRHSSEDGDPQWGGDKETAAENIILINRQRQVSQLIRVTALLKLCVIYFCKLFVSIKLQVGIWQKCCSIPTKIALDEA